MTHRDNSVSFGRRMCEKLKDLIPRQQFDIAIQAAIGAKIVARETVKHDEFIKEGVPIPPPEDRKEKSGN